MHMIITDFWIIEDKVLVAYYILSCAMLCYFVMSLHYQFESRDLSGLILFPSSDQAKDNDMNLWTFNFFFL